VIATFPKEVASRVCTQMRDNTPIPVARQIWDDCVQSIRTGNSRPPIVGAIRLGSYKWDNGRTWIVALSNFDFPPNERQRFRNTTDTMPTGFVLKATEADKIKTLRAEIQYPNGTCMRLTAPAQLSANGANAAITHCPY